MDISKIDENFKVEQYTETENDKRYRVPNDVCSLYGVFYDDARQMFLRMPYEVAEQVSPNVCTLNTNTAGGRVKFSTDSVRIGVRVGWDSLCKFPHMPLTGTSGFTLCEEDENGERFITVFKPDLGGENGMEQVWSDWRSRKKRDYVLYFPLYNQVRELEIIIDKDSELSDGKPYRYALPVLYYGSSITHGGCASRADTCYQAYIAKHLRADYINLGFSGSAKAEKAMADYLAGIPCSVFVCDYDYNAPDVEYLKATHFALYEAFRAKQPETPIVFVSAPSLEITDAFLNERLKVVRETYERALASGDKNVSFINGREILGKDDECCVVDGCHPNDLGFYRMSERIEAEVRKWLAIK